MDINGIILEPYREGWVIKYPYISQDRKTGEQKTQYKKAYFSRLGQCLQYIRDRLAKDCTTAQELVALLTAAEDIDRQLILGLMEVNTVNFVGKVQPNKRYRKCDAEQNPRHKCKGPEPESLGG